MVRIRTYVYINDINVFTIYSHKITKIKNITEKKANPHLKCVTQKLRHRHIIFVLHELLYKLCFGTLLNSHPTVDKGLYLRYDIFYITCSIMSYI